MELLNLLDSEEEIKTAIKFLLNSETKTSETESTDKPKKTYDTLQRFTLNRTEIAYCSQQEHAIDWFFSKALWNKKSNPDNPLELVKVIRNIQCTPLIVYLLIVTDILSEEKAEKNIDDIIEKLNQIDTLTTNNARFEEKKEFLRKIKVDIKNLDWAREIADRILKNSTSQKK